jgi:eukaryotic-like serine/threonine-protein kinase
MSIGPGARLGSYEVAAQIGAGGMGEVYRARDTKLDRDVAIKVLPSLFVADAERSARFQREARTLAALNHPNIGGIYGLEESNGAMALILELVEGPTLADRVAQGAIPVDEALAIARQIAEALEAAHEQGIVHRDLKPANIKLRPDGAVKVLDFGLAKALDPAPGPTSSLSISPTLTSPATQIGVILGTAAYMAPEQARGKPVDKRADIWAFGCVLFEMLTGRRTFDGQDVTDTIAAIVRGEPDWDSLPGDTPAPIRRLLKRCLAKDTKHRLREAGSAILEIDEARTSAREPDTAPVRAVPLWQRPKATAAIGLLVAAVVGAGTWIAARPASEPKQVVRFSIPLGPETNFSATGRHVVAISPQGTHMAYVANLQIYLRALNQFESTPVRGTEGVGTTFGRSPFFSPDGKWLGFWGDDALKRVAVTGGAPVTLTAAANPWGAWWGEDEKILYGQADGIWEVPATGGTPRKLVEAKNGETLHGPQRLPDGDWLLFTVRPAKVPNWDQARIVTQSLATGERKALIEGGRDARYLSSGHIVYASEGVLYAVPFNTRTRQVTGGAVSLVEGVGDAGTTTGAAHYSVAANGSLVYASIAGGGGAPASFVWVDRTGRETPVAARPRPYQEFNLSPDGNRIAVRVLDSMQDLWIYDLTRQTETRLTFDDAVEVYPTWTPDGRRVVFGGNGVELSARAADGTGALEVLAGTKQNATPFRIPQSFTPDGKTLIFELRGQGVKLNAVGLDDKRTVTSLFPETTGAQRNGALSPDGRWLAYESDESGTPEVYVRPFPDVNAGRWQVSAGGGRWPVWHPRAAGKELFYVSPKGLMSLSAVTTPTFTPGRVSTLFEMTAYTASNQANTNRRMAVSPDGQRFLFLKTAATQAGPGQDSQRVLFVENWIEELKQRVPVD